MCRYGVGKWRLIQKDEDYGPILTNRSNVDLKVSSHCCVVQVQCRWAGSRTAWMLCSLLLLWLTAQLTGHRCAGLPGPAAYSERGHRGLWVVREYRSLSAQPAALPSKLGRSWPASPSLLPLQDKWRNLNMDSIKNKKRDVAGDGGEGGLLDDDDFSVRLDSCSSWRLL